MYIPMVTHRRYFDHLFLLFANLFGLIPHPLARLRRSSPASLRRQKLHFPGAWISWCEAPAASGTRQPYLLANGEGTSWTMTSSRGATRMGYEGAVRELFESEVDVDEAGADDRSTALHIAAWEGHKGVVEQLMKAGADVDKARAGDGCAPLYTAAEEGHEGAVEQLLKAGADVDKAPTDNGATALYIAAINRHEGIVEKLLKAGADVNKATTDDGTTPLYFVARFGHGGVVEQLLKAGADPNAERSSAWKTKNLPQYGLLQWSHQDLLAPSRGRSEHEQSFWRRRSPSPDERSGRRPSGGGGGPGLDGAWSIMQRCNTHSANAEGSDQVDGGGNEAEQERGE